MMDQGSKQWMATAKFGRRGRWAEWPVPAAGEATGTRQGRTEQGMGRWREVSLNKECPGRPRGKLGGGGEGNNKNGGPPPGAVIWLAGYCLHEREGEEEEAAGSGEDSSDERWLGAGTSDRTAVGVDGAR
ncbi:hypothetical protein NL676_022875 [Syzygium grande]|nr:hypothetical protein NL676_022875 [Syzygium grande]